MEQTVAVLTLSGEFASRVAVILRTNSSLIMALGTIQETRRRVMVPFLEVALAGTTHAQIEKVGEVDEDGLSEMFSCVLSLDNAVWMQFDMLRDMRRAVGDLATVVNQDALEGARLRQALRYAERIRAEADKLMTALKVVAKEA